MLTEIRWHGRAGQGIITASRLLAYAAILEDKHAQAFPEFGPERIGAPISGFTRISDQPIEIHSKIYQPDVVVVLDPTVMKMVNVTEGLKEKGKLLVNSKERPRELSSRLGIDSMEVYTLNATRISIDVLGDARALNTIMLGALIGATSLVSLDSVIKALGERFKGSILEKNVQLLRRGFSEVRNQ
ncbi:MAG: 2-oxoacid:acceptor oxidoreductase family protein [Candidatus Bathyarchaeia archaeon]|nr:2-oxoacid:acceptor oxidoreductase family protein [Candidatus Bathyarchaeota archaeon]